MEETKKLRMTIKKTLTKAEEYNCKTVAIPPISSGIFSYPKLKCAEDILDELENYAESMKGKDNSLQEVRLVMFDDETFNVFEDVFKRRYQRGNQGSYNRFDS